MEKSILLDLKNIANPLVWVKSQEEIRLVEQETPYLMARNVSCPTVFVWDIRMKIYEARGILGGDSQRIQEVEYDTIIDAIDSFVSDPDTTTVDDNTMWDIKQHGFPNGSTLFMLDIAAAMVDPSKVNHTNATVCRALKVAAQKAMHNRNKMIVIVSHTDFIPPELEGVVTFVDHALPSIEYLKGIVSGCAIPCGHGNQEAPVIEMDEEYTTKIAQQVSGITAWQAEHVLLQANRANAMSYILSPSSTQRQYDTDVIHNEKARLLSRSGTIEVIKPDFNLSGVGGMQNLKTWAKDREIIFRHEAREEGIDLPKGILVCGAGGTGKSHLAKALSKEWGRPLLRLDISACMGSLLGESEGKLIKALKDAEAQSPCILFVDEFEKLFAGASGASTDGGTFQRMYGTWLTWTQSRQADVFVVATTNGVERLPAPALRKGRFDEIFFIDLPGEKEREDIFKIHLNKRGWNHKEFDIDCKKLSTLTPNRTGSEIEQIVIQSLIDKVKSIGFGKDNALTTDIIINAIPSVRTMYELNPEESGSIRKWAQQHNVMFASVEDTAASTSTSSGSSSSVAPQKRKLNINI